MEQFNGHASREYSHMSETMVVGWVMLSALNSLRVECMQMVYDKRIREAEVVWMLVMMVVMVLGDSIKW